ncbi:helix-turn-helix domain-containing protein [Nocardia salmonicida]|uniref:helix-turn-helix domain-containing protein n=1 Tax=Nocardia salmonicida TaxID=53431 RepID=UPI00378DFE6F
MAQFTKPRQIDPDIGRRIRDVRTEQGVSLRELARLIEVSPAAVSALENGRSSITVERLQRIATVLEVPVTELLVGPAAADRSVGGGAASPPAPIAWREFDRFDLDPVLRAALTVMVEKGYHGCSIRDIAEHAGSSVATLYRYYPSKHAMLTALMEATMADILARSRAARDEGTDSVHRFRLLVESIVLHHTYRRELAFIGSSEMRSLDPGTHRRIASERTALQRLVDIEVTAAVAADRFHTENPHEAARAVVTMCMAVVQWYNPHGPQLPEELARIYVSMALDLVRHRD